VVYQFTENPDDEIKRAVALADRAVSHGADATALAIVGNALTSAHELDKAALVVGKALALDGGSAWAWSRSGWIDTYAGRPEAAVSRFAVALDLAPHDPLAFNAYVGLGAAHFAAGRYAEAAGFFARGVAEHPSAAWAHRMLAPSYLLHGKPGEAARSVDIMRRSYPGLSVGEIVAAIPLQKPTADRLADALESLGLPPGR
jgi:tetratricopeptide (TPR) repeat protein